MTVEEAQAIIRDKAEGTKWQGDNAFQGLLLIAKFIDPAKHSLICDAGHDEIYGPSFEALIEAGMGPDEFKALARLNWSVSDYDTLSCFV